MTPPDTLIDLLRHGTPVGGRRYRGNSVDDPLSATGWAQMLAATDGPVPWRRIVTSPMQRCHAFADWLGQQHHLPVRVEPRFKEVGFGAWEGKNGDDIRAADPDALRRFYADPDGQRPAGAEALGDFRARVSAGIEQILKTPHGHTLIICHAGVIRAAVAHVLQQPLRHLYRINIDTASLTRIRQTAERPPSLDFISRPKL